MTTTSTVTTRPNATTGNTANADPDGSEQFSAMLVSHTLCERRALTGALTEMGARPLHHAGSVGEALICARTWGPCELAVVDLDLPDGHGMSLVGVLESSGWDRVVVLSSAATESTVETAFSLGARGVLMKTVRGVPGRRQRTAITMENELRDSEPRAARVVGADGLTKKVSGREIQVLQLLAHGCSNKDVADRLGVSPMTVKSHLTRIGRKLETGDRAELVALAMRAKAIS